MLRKKLWRAPQGILTTRYCGLLPSALYYGPRNDIPEGEKTSGEISVTMRYIYD